MEMIDIWIVGFAPDYTYTYGTGGFDWYIKYSDAVEQLRELNDAPGFDYRLVRAKVPLMSGDEITEYLDQRRELWDPPDVRQFMPPLDNNID